MAYLSGYAKRDEYVIQASKVSAGVTDFPVYVDLADLSADFWSNVKSDGADIRVTRSDETTECAIEVVDIDTTAETGELHFKANTISSSSNTTFYIYYGDATATAYGNTDTYGRNNVWSDYGLVYHFSDASGNATDSAGNNDGVPSGTVNYQQTGKIGYAADFPGANSANYFAAGPDPTLDLDGADFTLQTWVNIDQSTDRNWFFDKGDSSNTNQHLITGYRRASKGNEMLFGFYANDLDTSSGYSGDVGNWVQWHFTLDVSGNARTIYRNGVSVANDSGQNLSNTNSESLWVGAAGRTGVSADMDGKMDEVRARLSTLSSDWISIEHNNQDDHSTWAVVTAETSGGGGGGPAIIAARRAIFFGI